MKKEKIENFVNEIFSNEQVPEDKGNDMYEGKPFWIKNSKRFCTFVLTYMCKYEPDNLSMSKFRECLDFDFFKSEIIKARISQDKELEKDWKKISYRIEIFSGFVTCILTKMFGVCFIYDVDADIILIRRFL